MISNQGCFTRQDLKDIWHEDKYALMRGELLELMSKFQLCYEISSCQDTFISPQLLSDNQPEYEWNSANNLILRYVYPKFMPKGIISRLIVVMHDFINQQEYVWKSGVILNKDNTQAEVIEYYGRREITIKISGLHRRNLITIIAHELDKINNSYQGLQYNQLIPCNCQECHSSNETYFYAYQELQKLIQKKPDVQCRSSGDMVNIRHLIDGVFIRSNIKQTRDTEDQPTTKIEQYTEQHFYGNVGNATGSIARDQNLTDTTIQHNRNLKINQGNYNEHVAGDSISYSTVIDIINQLPSFNNEPVKKELKELLRQLP